MAVNGQIIEKFDRDKSFLIAIGNQALRVIDYTVNGQTLEESFNVICKSMEPLDLDFEFTFAHHSSKLLERLKLHFAVME